MKKQEQRGTYLVKYYCFNCKRYFDQVFEFGEVASQGQCPFCGVSPNQLKRAKFEQVKEYRSGDN